MMSIALLAWRSAWSRRLSLLLAFASILMSVVLLLAVERIRLGARDSFVSALSGTDLIIGPRSHPVQLLLHAVFHVGDEEAGMSWDSVERISAYPSVAWAVPISLGDSHRGFSVIATSPAYFSHYRYGGGRALAFAAGRPFAGLFDVVLGSEVARRLGYTLGSQLTLSHGTEEIGEHGHHKQSFTVVGILAPTGGTPVDRSLHIGLPAMEAIHLDWQGGAQMPGMVIGADDLRKFDLHPHQASALLLGLKQRAAVLRVQRRINAGEGEALSAVIPAVALDQLWEMTATTEKLLRSIAAIVLAVALAGMVAAILAGLGERRRELAILRAVGARPRHIVVLLLFEGGGLALAGAVAGLAVLQAASALAAPWLSLHWGIDANFMRAGSGEAVLLAMIVGAGLLASLLPGWRAYHLSLADGLLPKV